MQVRPYHEGPSTSPSLVASRPQVGPTNSALSHPQSKPAAGKDKGRAMVLRGQWTCRLLLRTGHDHAGAARGVVKSGDVLPWRSNHGAAEGLERFGEWSRGRTPAAKAGTYPFLPPNTAKRLLRVTFWNSVQKNTGYRPARFPYNRSQIISSQNPVLARARSSIGKSIGFLIRGLQVRFLPGLPDCPTVLPVRAISPAAIST